MLVWKTIGREEVVDTSAPIRLRSLFGLLRHYDILTINLANVCVFVARQGILNTVVPLYARLNLGMTLSDLGIILSIGAVGNLATMLLSGSMTDRYGRKPFFLAGLGLAAFFTAMVPLASDPVQLTVAVAGLSLSLGLAGPMAAWLTDVVDSKDLGGAMGLFRTMGDLGFVIAPVALAALAGTAGSISAVPFLLAAAFIAVTALPLLRTSDPAGADRMSRAVRRA